MSKFDMNKQIKLNVINRNNSSMKISIIVGGSLTISHLKRKIQTQFYQLYSIQIVIRVIEDKNGFIISNNSVVEEHFQSGDTIYFSEHGESQKNGSNMNMAANLGQILSTVKFMTASALDKLDKIDLTNSNIMQMTSDLLYLGLWYNNPTIVKKLYKILNKIFGQTSIQKFLISSKELDMSMLLRNFNFWLIDIPNSTAAYQQIVWELLQLLEKLTCNQKFCIVIKNHKLSKCVLEMSKDTQLSGQVKKMCIRIIKNVNVGGGKNMPGINKMKSEYIPSVLGISSVNGYGTQDILSFISTGSPDQKLNALQYFSQNNFDIVAQATVRFDYYQKLTNIFTIRKIKSKKHIVIINQIISKMSNNSSKDQCIDIVQKDIFKKIHSFMLEAPVETHSACLQYLSKISKVSSNLMMFNLQKSYQLLKSPYPQFQKSMISGILCMSQKLGSVLSIRFIPGIKDFITICLKTNDNQIIHDLLKIISNLSLDQQCRYQILNLKGIQVFVKFLQTSKIPQICRVSAKGLLNLAISSRQNKAKVLGAMNTVLQRFYRTQFDSITNGYIQTILKSKNI